MKARVPATPEATTQKARGVTFHVSPEDFQRLKLLGVYTERTTESLMREAFQDLLHKHRKVV